MNEQIYFNNKEYSYLPDYNILTNTKTENILKKYGKTVKNRSILLNEALVREEVKRINTIVFELTENCNLRCKYCIYSGHFYFHRKHSKNCMNFDIARKTIDYFYNLLKNSPDNEIGLAFYGGEPLLNLSLMREIVDYFEKRFYDWKIHYILSTNGTLLHKKDIIKYMISKEFDMRISIDGPEKNHDAYRVYINGKGTFERIIRNLELIYKKSKRYFSEHISIGVTHSSELSLLEIYDFFNNKKIFEYIGSISIGDASRINSDLYDNFEYESNRKAEEDRIFEQIKSKVREKKRLLAIDRAFIEIYNIQDKLDKRIYFHTQSTCRFNSRAFITVNGDFHICERGNHRFKIGDYRNGYDYKKMVDIYYNFKKTLKKSCSRCSYRFLCDLCFASIENDGYFSLSEEFCRDRRSFIEYSMERYIELNQEEVFEYANQK